MPQVANNFNNCFINVAKDIGNDNNLSAEEHPSIKIIKENKKVITKLILLFFLILLLNFFAFDMPPNFCYFYLLKNYYVSSVFYKQHFSGFYS
jgi:hypothetical protein